MNDDSNPVFLPIMQDPQSQIILDLARKIAKSKSAVLINGETGAGKEILARYIHEHSTFRAGPFVAVNCAALPENMIEAILFGYERGAFTGAVNSYAGKFEQAHRGTLLLDEVSEIPLDLQAKILRALQEHEVDRLCGKKAIPVEVRIIAATNRDLAQQVSAGFFRKDLYYRLNVLPIYCAPLRERPADILPLAQYFLAEQARSLNVAEPQLTEQAKQKLLAYAWPGNIRELDNVMQRTIVMCDHSIIDAVDIDLNEQAFSMSTITDEVHYSGSLRSRIKENEAKLIVDVLKTTNGCREVAAKKLNISPRTLRYKISKLKAIGLKVP